MKQSNHNNGRRQKRRPKGGMNGHAGNGGHFRNNFDSNGPGGKLKGNAHQLYERYVLLARDATSSGDGIAGESLLQHAEHYFRINQEQEQHRSRQQRERPQYHGHTEQSVEPQTGAGPEASGDEDAPQRLPSFLYNKANLDESDFDQAAAEMAAEATQN